METTVLIQPHVRRDGTSPQIGHDAIGIGKYRFHAWLDVVGVVVIDLFEWNASHSLA